MQKISFVDETFDLNFTSEYHLSIQLSLDGLSFCILDGIQKKYILLEHKPIISNSSELSVKRLKDLYQEDERLNASYKSTRIIYSSSRGSFVPASYFQKNKSQRIIKLNLGELKNESTLNNTLTPFSDQIVFGIPSSLLRFLNEKYPETNITHECIPFLWNALRGKNEKGQLAILIRNNYFWLIYTEDKQLQFCNTFTWQNDEDILYFVMNIVSSLQVDPSNTPIYVDGLSSKRTAIYHRLRQYLKQVILAEPSSDYHYSYLFDQLPDNRFVTLLNLQTCVL